MVHVLLSPIDPSGCKFDLLIQIKLENYVLDKKINNKNKNKNVPGITILSVT
jgi:hypothetical protein